MYISNSLLNASMSARLKGYLYLCDAIELAFLDQSKLLHIIKTIYPELAHKYHVSPKQAERSIRYAIRVCINKCPPDVLYEIFGNSLNPEDPIPTNTEFISAFVHYIKNREHEFIHS